MRKYVEEVVVVAALVVAFHLSGCGSGEAPHTCIAGEQRSCPCPGGGQGVQVCSDDGTHLGACSACGLPNDLASGAYGDRGVNPIDLGASASDLGAGGPDFDVPDANAPSDLAEREAMVPGDLGENGDLPKDGGRSEGGNLDALGGDGGCPPLDGGTDGWGVACAVDLDCFDGNTCTEDKCVCGKCQHPTRFEGLGCMVMNTMGTCREGACCTNCWDSVNHQCRYGGDDVAHCGNHGAVCSSCDDNNPCTTDQCNSAICANVVLSDGSGCPDGTCVGGMCVACGLAGQACCMFGGITGWCQAPNGSLTCSNGTCSMLTCYPGYADCNMNAMDGCEVNLRRDWSNCGACGKGCPKDQICYGGACGCPNCWNAFPNAAAQCINNQCVFSKCSLGFADCDGNIQNGCEVNTFTDGKNCAACGMVCPQNLPYCVYGVCSNGCVNGHLIPNLCVQQNDPETNDPWVVCQADCNSAWVSHANANGGTYHATQICQTLGYAQIGKYGGTCSDICGYCGKPQVGTCANPGTMMFDGGGNQGIDQWGLILGRTVQWQCLK